MEIFVMVKDNQEINIIDSALESKNVMSRR